MACACGEHTRVTSGCFVKSTTLACNEDIVITPFWDVLEFDRRSGMVRCLECGGGGGKEVYREPHWRRCRPTTNVRACSSVQDSVLFRWQL